MPTHRPKVVCADARIETIDMCGILGPTTAGGCRAGFGRPPHNLKEWRMTNSLHSFQNQQRWSAFSRMAVFFLFTILLSSAGLVHAQDFRATLFGQVTDPSGAAISGASVKAIN